VIQYGKGCSAIVETKEEITEDDKSWMLIVFGVVGGVVVISIIFCIALCVAHAVNKKQKIPQIDIIPPTPEPEEKTPEMPEPVKV